MMHHLARVRRSTFAQHAAKTLWAVILPLTLACNSIASELREAQELYRTGKYAECANVSAAEIKDGIWDVAWPILQAKAELAQGNYAAALRTVEENLDRFDSSLELRLVARTVYRFNNKPDRARDMLEEIAGTIASDPSGFRSEADRVALGRYLLERGADPRQILELIYDPLRKASPELAEVYYAAAELALDKYDNALAAETLEAAPKALADDPQYHFLLARAYAADEPKRAHKEIEAALAINANHVDSRLLRVNGLINAEEYAAASEMLDRVFALNPNHATAWAYKAAIAHLTNDEKTEKEAREQALSTWAQNPEVDYLIGKKLSENYRFAESAQYQRKALAFEPSYRPAKLQLSQDLLRLGEEAEGWRLADEVAKQDAYDVVAFNLVTLQGELAKFRTIRGDGLCLRMDPREAQLYGDRAVEVLQRARATLCARYEVELDEPIVIEIFPKQKDFAVRTFGMPGVPRGYLGVCFGRVVTANSPASQGERPANWESVLWHEFCHVVTLHKTRNKMPRWLSEGISVYEERQANPAWGQSLNEAYRAMILDGETMTPVSQLSSAFLAPKSPQHLQFAYFESSLVVEYLVERYGVEKLLALLDDLGAGHDINEALVVHTEPLNRLDADFQEFARRRAVEFEKQAQFDPVDLPVDVGDDALTSWVKEHPKNVRALKKLARTQLRNKHFEAALETAEDLREIFASDTGSENAYTLMAEAHRGLKNEEAERQALEELARRSDAASDAYMRLMALAGAKQDWEAMAKNARRMLAVNPLVAAPHRHLAQAAEQIGQRQEAIRAYQALLQFETTDIVDTHYHLALLMRDENHDEAARRHVLAALEEAPRFLAAHKLLLELTPDEGALAESGEDQDKAN